MVSTAQITYYENMIDIVKENQKINELLMAPKFMTYFTESKDEIALCEGKVVDAIFDFIKKILDKVIQFFKKIINIFSDTKFIANKKLISTVEEILKNSPKEAKDNFGDTIKINIVGNDPYLDYLLEFSEECIKKLENIVYDLKDLIYKDIEDHWIKKDIENFNLELKTPTETALKVKYNDLKEIISQYENTYARVKSIRKRMQADEISMNNYKRTVESIARKNKDIHTEVLSKYRSVTVSLCNLLMKANSEVIKEMMRSFKTYEGVLKLLVENSKEKDVKNIKVSQTFKDAVDKKDTRLVRIMLKDSLLTDKTFTTFNLEIKYAERLDDLYDEHDGRELPEDKSLWNIDLMNQEMVRVVGNFSKERIAFLKKLVTHVYKK